MRGDGPRGPLAGIRVVEPAGIGPCPFAGMILAEMGADVVRVDRPARGVLDAAEPAADLLGRGKRSIVLDLKRPEAVAALLDLCDTADVLLEGFRPGWPSASASGRTGCTPATPASSTAG
ncbi:CoA transferase [Actinomadura madurae]|nr:CoA transferase [Actinomadura madurae]URN02026.1 CoA transferase [Actinomadura madurae]